MMGHGGSLHFSTNLRINIYTGPNDGQRRVLHFSTNRRRKYICWDQ